MWVGWAGLGLMGLMGGGKRRQGEGLMRAGVDVYTSYRKERGMKTESAGNK